ncbi:hypothetical protein [Terribacillus saccharophilus]|uniref:Glycosyl hydrolases family 8 n=1 Tax=Terribacillus saccharophilus TaxID=361277 RepID=A0A268AEW6_9BACI|nr:hypothetical protein [Terribacillus saccharophilus]PAD22668.1 hypothetical protein CHH64_02860 [Terribacillus saccharophilus]PAF39935.1 hypothetical protein CHH69_05620 [Terribacillus saccharophilus]
MMQHKSFVAKLLLLLACSLLLFLNFSSSVDQKTVTRTVKQQYKNKDGFITSYGDKERGTSPILLESLGQYMEYLLTVGDSQEFEEQFLLLQSNFTVDTDEGIFLKWQLEEDVTANASVDDYRIIRTLLRGGEQFHNSSYINFARQIWTTMNKTQTVNGLIVDFYDWSSQQRTSEIHLSYIDYDVLEKMQASKLNRYEQILSKGQTDNPFFYEIYDPENNSYQTANSETVNMIDQFLIAIQYAESTHEKPKSFHDWVNTQVQNYGILYGSYNRNTGKPAVDYESSAVYALGVIYSLTVDDQKTAEILYSRLQKQSPLQLKPNYNDIHFFDYMYASYAATLYEEKKSSQ